MDGRCRRRRGRVVIAATFLLSISLFINIIRQVHSLSIQSKKANFFRDTSKQLKSSKQHRPPAPPISVGITTTPKRSSYVERFSSSSSSLSSSSSNPKQSYSRRNTTGNSINMIIDFVGSTTSSVVSVSCFLAFIYYRNALSLSLSIGGILNAIFGKVLKKILKQSRPQQQQQQQQQQSSQQQSSSSSSSDADAVILRTAVVVEQPNDHGMPSSHAMSLGYVAICATCIVPWIALPMTLYVVTSLYYRVKVHLHTTSQVIVGTILGTCNGYGWYQFSTGTNPFRIHFNEIWRRWILNDDGLIPISVIIIQGVLSLAIIRARNREELIRLFLGHSQIGDFLVSQIGAKKKKKKAK